MLSINFYSECDAIDLIEDDIVLDNSRCFMSVPLDRYATRFVFTYTTCDSIESYEMERYRKFVPTLTDYFTVSCNYLVKIATGLNRLTNAPVFFATG